MIVEGLACAVVGLRQFYVAVNFTDEHAESVNGLPITWDDGQQVTWRRDSLADRPIEILVGDDGPSTTPPSPTGVEPAESPAAETPAADPESATEPPAAETPAAEPTTLPAAPAAPEAATSAESAAAEFRATEAANAATTEAAPTVTRPKQQRETSRGPKEKKRSVLDAAGKVLGEMGQAMGCQELIATMAVKGYWTSPGGQTPAATLYSALLREITTKGAQARFVKTGRGKFALRPRT
jgi:hypothetical protein